MAALLQTDQTLMQRVTRDKEGHYLKIKGDKPTRRCNSCKYLCTQLRSAQMYKTINDKHNGNNQQYNSRGTQPPFTAMDRAPEQTINKVTMVLNDTLDQMGLLDKLRTFHTKTAQYIFFSSAHGTSSRRDHILGHKTGLNTFKNIKVIRCTFFRPQGYET